MKRKSTESDNTKVKIQRIYENYKCGLHDDNHQVCQIYMCSGNIKKEVECNNKSYIN